MYHSDPTGNQAIGNIGREWRRMAALALRLRDPNRTRHREWEERQRARFVGIYRRLLDDPIDELEQMVKPKKRQADA